MEEGVNMEADMTIESSATTEPPGVKRRSVLGRGGGPLARAVARAPVSVRAKHLVAFGVIVVLLVVVAAAGLLALGHSNSRAKQLGIEQQKTGLVQSLLSDATFLQSLVQSRWVLTAAPGSKGVTPTPNAYYSSIDSAIRGAEGLLSSAALLPTHSWPTTYLHRFYPGFETKVQNKLQLFENDGNHLAERDLLGRGASATGLVHSELKLAGWFVARLGVLNRQAQARTHQVVAESRSSFASSRSLVIGVAAGSIALALALALLISSSLLVPLRKTGARMAEIAAGDFAGHLEVPNRDEIGTLAANVNQMSDELGRLYQELETASRHKSDFLATMSHELRTPLNAIIGFSEVLQEQMFGELNERQLAYIDDVLEAGRHLLSLINDVLDLAKIEAGKMELDVSQVALPALLRSAVSMHAERAARAGIELSLSTEPDEITIGADERRVRQIVVNLLSNAVKFTPPDGRVDVSARLDDGEVEIAVADTGSGIATEDLETIFEEFEQTSGGKKAEGAGLGLPLSRKLVELHGGLIWAESAMGRGSTFRFTLPTGHGAAT
jgi:signal transduction histidine kinase